MGLSVVPHSLALPPAPWFASPSFLRALGLFSLLLVPLLLTGCGSSSRAVELAAPLSNPNQAVLLYVGAGTSSTDVDALKSVLQNIKLKFETANADQLNAMTEVQIASHSLLIVPGGNSINIGQNLSSEVSANIRTAVQQHGLHYLGICAGAFYGGYSVYNGVNLTSGVSFDFFADESRGIHKEPVSLLRADNSSVLAYWEDGPQLSGWGDVVAKYPDGTPAITQGQSGRGFVVFTGVHLEAPASWWEGFSVAAPVNSDGSYAATVIEAARTGNPLPHF